MEFPNVDVLPPGGKEHTDKQAVAFFKKAFARERPEPSSNDLKLDVNLMEKMRKGKRGGGVPGVTKMLKGLFT